MSRDRINREFNKVVLWGLGGTAAAIGVAVVTPLTVTTGLMMVGFGVGAWIGHKRF